MSNTQTTWNTCNSVKQVCAQCISFQALTLVLAPSVASYLDTALALVHNTHQPGQNKAVLGHAAVAMKYSVQLKGQDSSYDHPASYQTLVNFSNNFSGLLHFNGPALPLDAGTGTSRVAIAVLQLRNQPPLKDNVVMDATPPQIVNPVLVPTGPCKKTKTLKKPVKSAPVIIDSEDGQGRALVKYIEQNTNINLAIGSPTPDSSETLDLTGLPMLLHLLQVQREHKPIDAAMLFGMKITKTNSPYYSGDVVVLPYHYIPGMSTNSPNYFHAIQAVERGHANTIAAAKKLHTGNHADVAIVDSDSDHDTGSDGSLPPHDSQKGNSLHGHLLSSARHASR
ncbi:hypothetical protein C8J56DRAFT_1091543 [Mycena floridula]|nr:hypothetical protein C8J56DRAFT_1091543 [Mycena floridula]